MPTSATLDTRPPETPWMCDVEIYQEFGYKEIEAARIKAISDEREQYKVLQVACFLSLFLVFFLFNCNPDEGVRDQSISMGILDLEMSNDRC